MWGLRSVRCWDSGFSPITNRCFLFFAFKTFPHYMGANAKACLRSTQTTFMFVFFFDSNHKCQLDKWSKTQNKGKNDHIVWCEWFLRASFGFSGGASTLLFSSVWWPLHPQKVEHRGTGLCQQKNKVEMLLFMSKGSPVYQRPEWDNGVVEERSGRRTGWGQDGGTEWAVEGGRLFGALRSQCYLMKMKWSVKNQ